MNVESQVKHLNKLINSFLSLANEIILIFIVSPSYSCDFLFLVCPSKELHSYTSLKISML